MYEFGLPQVFPDIIQEPKWKLPYPINSTGSYVLGIKEIYNHENDPYKWLKNTELSQSIKMEIEFGLQNLKLSHVIIPNPFEVHKYLEKYPELIGIVLMASQSAREKFDPEDQLSLEIFNDHESDNQTLTLYIRKKHYIGSLLKTINDITDEYSPFLADKNGWFVLTTDYQPAY